MLSRLYEMPIRFDASGAQKHQAVVSGLPTFLDLCQRHRLFIAAQFARFNFFYDQAWAKFVKFSRCFFDMPVQNIEN